MKKKKAWKRGAGVLLPISSLPSPYGIGTFGKAAYEFIDNLAEAKQTYWQVLPIGPTSYGDSPYQSFSAFAGNPYFIDLDTLIEEGLLTEEDVKLDWGSEANKIDYEKIYNNRFLVLKKAYKNSYHKNTKNYKQFKQENTFWLFDYSFYMAVKDSFQSLSWTEWEEDIRFRKPEAIKKYQKKYKDEIEFYSFCQYKFYEQWGKLRTYANEKGIKIIGDIPLYVSMDSADVWVHGDLFELDERKKPIHIAGVPPDCFSETGQRWGNPLYRWDKHEQDGFDWWCQRIKANANFYDIIRIDHFIGIVRFYSIPESCPTAMEGEWREGPGKKLTDAIARAVPEADFIAEDLGVIVPSVRSLQKKTGWPGMKVLEFAFDGPENEYLPHNYTERNCVVYGGTHDNEPLLGYFYGKKRKELKFIFDYLHIKRVKDIPEAVIRLGYSSMANLVINQMQDILGLDHHAKMNTPGTLGGNWEWRLLKGQFGEKEIEWLRGLTETFGRYPLPKQKKKKK